MLIPSAPCAAVVAVDLGGVAVLRYVIRVAAGVVAGVIAAGTVAVRLCRKRQRSQSQSAQRVTCFHHFKPQNLVS